MLERLEPADRAAELPALLQVGDGGRQAPLGDADLLGGHQRGAGADRPSQRGIAVRGRDHQLTGARRRAVTSASCRVMSRETTGVDLRRDRGHGVHLDAVRGGDRHEQDVGLERTGHTGHRAGEPAVLAAAHAGQRQRPAPSRAAPPARPSCLPRPASRAAAESESNRTVVATTALVRNGTGATERPSSSSTTAASRADAPAPPRVLGHQQAGQAQVGGQRLPEAADQRPVAVVHRQDCGGVTAVGEEAAHACRAGRPRRRCRAG